MLTDSIHKPLKLYIKNMVSLRCILSVKAELDKAGIAYQQVTLGEVLLTHDPGPEAIEQLEKALNKIDLFIIQDKKSILTTKIKNVIIQMMQGEELPKENYSWYISNKLGHNYTYLANLFSQQESITIEHFIIAHKIEKVKQLLLENETTLTEIAHKLNYSSVAHLSSQFKKVTGINPSQFRQLEMNNRR